MSNYQQFLTRCQGCGKPTSKQYARLHDGFCKKCVGPDPGKAERDNALLIDSGYQAYTRERGDYDQGDY